MITQENYKEAIEKWKKDNPNLRYLDVPGNTVIELADIGKINLGDKICKTRQIYKAMQEGNKYLNRNNLTDEEIEFWTSQGMIWDYQKWKDENYRKAIEKWKKDNPDKKYLDVAFNTVIMLDGIGEIRLGCKISKTRLIYSAMQQGEKFSTRNDLTEEEIEFWTSQGMIWDYEKFREDNYKKAIEIWKKENPDKYYLDIPQKTKINIEGVGLIEIGRRIQLSRKIYSVMQEGKSYGENKDLSTEWIDYLNSQGMIWDYEKWKENIYRQAVEKWKKENPDKKLLDMPSNTEVDIEGVGLINISARIYTMRRIYDAMSRNQKFGGNNDLTKEQIDYWTSQGMIWDSNECKINKKIYKNV